ncbi:hypothetical protein CRG98_029290 [Punica granatum]|uniref:UDP-rhamnose:rhamnosyltransferase 1 n=1 Tax=Punica granatum TaxID=22663 RepID=A0A2I0J247_PUNGR|nr:hypothetical protein CRG98_029290 [Punica granatum]
MLPWSAFGHIIPFFQLSISLARNGVQVSFVSTRRNIQRLPQVPADVLSLIHFVDLPLPQLDGNILAEGDEATVDIPFEKIQYLKIAYDRLKYPFEQLVISKCSDWIINDFIPYWVIEISQKNEIPVALFSVFSAAVTVFVGPPESLFTDGVKRLRPSSESLTVRPPWVDFPSSVAFRSHEAASLYAGFYGDNASGISDACRTAEVLQSCDLVAFRSCPEYEGQYLKVYETLVHKKVIPVGWGSVIETLQFGHCLVVLPLIIDQPLQARLLVEKGNKLRSNAKDAIKIFGDHELHRGYATKFVEYLRDNVKNKSLD